MPGWVGRFIGCFGLTVLLAGCGSPDRRAEAPRGAPPMTMASVPGSPAVRNYPNNYPVVAAATAVNRQTDYTYANSGYDAYAGANADSYRVAPPMPSAVPASAPVTGMTTADGGTYLYVPGQSAMRPYPVAVQHRAADGGVRTAAVDATLRYDKFGRPVIVQTSSTPSSSSPSCPGPMTASGEQGKAIWIGCGAPPPGATLPPVMSPEVRQSLGVRLKS